MSEPNNNIPVPGLDPVDEADQVPGELQPVDHKTPSSRTRGPKPSNTSTPSLVTETNSQQKDVPRVNQQQATRTPLELIDPGLYKLASNGPAFGAQPPPNNLPGVAEPQRDYLHPRSGFCPPLALMRPAQVQPAPLEMPASRPAAAVPALHQQGNNNGDLAQSLQALWRNHWDQIIDLFGQKVPPSLRAEVLDKLAINRYEWSGNKLYRDVVGIDKTKDGDLQKLKEWMYSARGETDATWRDTLRTKPPGARTVPWVKRERLIALSVVLAGMGADQNRHRNKMQNKFNLIQDCKLEYLLSGQDQVVVDPYWVGFVEELDQDPDQEHLYDNVMRIKKSPSPVKIKEEPGVHGYNLRSSRQGNDGHQAGADEPQNGGGQEESLEDKVRRLEEENDAMRKEIASKNQRSRHG